MNRRHLSTLALAASLALGAGFAPAAFAQAKGEVKIALIASKTGPLEAFAKQTITGFNLGLEYATNGTMTVAGKKITVIEKDGRWTWRRSSPRACRPAAWPTSDSWPVPQRCAVRRRRCSPW